ncbi:ABC transporter permease [Parashewanella tropica]|uniref:ABC transporter permease n=1 Tax=Parashewanella tropica TaxID=2547970 RepID=UPI001059567E|nr:FtsX-like permease family protein [Parashewanella tropica]
MELNLAWRLFKRELLQGQLVLILLAITLAVLSVSGLSRVSERLQTAISGEASKFIAADRIIDSPEKLKPAILQKSTELGLKHATNLEFNSMVYSGDDLQLVEVKAVSDTYPLKGNIELTTGETHQLPPLGSVWYETRLAGLLGNPKQIEIGVATFKMDKAISRLPDAGFNPFASSPVVLMRMEDVAKTQIVQPGSRLDYRYQFTGTPDQLKEFEDYVTPQLLTTQRWRDVESGDSPLAGAIKRAERFLLLASLLGIALACTAIGIAAQRYCQRHYDVVAMLKTFGSSAKQIRFIFTFHLLFVSFLGVILGLLGGWLLDIGLTQFLPENIAAYDPSIWRPVILGVVTGLLSAFMFSVYPLMRLLKIPPLRVLQRQLESHTVGQWFNIVLSLLALGLLGYLYSKSLTLTLIVMASVVMLAVLLLVVGFVMIRLGHSSGLKISNPVQLAFAGLRRRAKQNAVQLVGFSSALVLLLIIFALRQDLLNEWQQQLPKEAPNYFLVNIAPEDSKPLEDFFNDKGVKSTDIYPVIRGRMSAIDGEKVVTRKQQEAGEEGRLGITRELNLTWRNTLPPNNEIVAGKFNSEANDVSVESEVAERLNLKLGDTVTFMIENQPVTAKVTSLRKVHWETLQPNFYFIFSKQALGSFDYTSIASFYLDQNKTSNNELIIQLIKQFPTISIIDVGAMVGQLREIIEQVSLSLTLVLVLVLLASALVLLAQTEAGMASRRRELAVLRTFGGSGWLLRLSTFFEFALLGAISGLLAVWVTEFALYLLKTQVFELTTYMHWNWWWLAPLSGAAVVASLGLWCCWHLLTQSCSNLLKEG